METAANRDCHWTVPFLDRADLNLEHFNCQANYAPQHSRIAIVDNVSRTPQPQSQASVAQGVSIVLGDFGAQHSWPRSLVLALRARSTGREGTSGFGVTQSRHWATVAGLQLPGSPQSRPFLQAENGVSSKCLRADNWVRSPALRAWARRPTASVSASGAENYVPLRVVSTDAPLRIAKDKPTTSV